jgi:SAM-dependent MidA family methyltransferase
LYSFYYLYKSVGKNTELIIRLKTLLIERRKESIELIASVIVIDYCTPLTAEVASMPWREWLRTYASHDRGVHYLRNVGDQDITTQVLIDQLSVVREPDAIRTQSQFLQLWGIDELVEEGKRAWEAAASAPSLVAMKMRSRIAESEALLDPTGLGNFTVLEWKNATTI